MFSKLRTALLYAANSISDVEPEPAGRIPGASLFDIDASICCPVISLLSNPKVLPIISLANIVLFSTWPVWTPLRRISNAVSIDGITLNPLSKNAVLLLDITANLFSLFAYSLD